MGNSFTLLLAMVYAVLTLISHASALGATPTFPEMCARLNFVGEGGYTYSSPFGGVVRSGQLPFEAIARFSPMQKLELLRTFEETKIRLKRAVQDLAFISDEAKTSIIARIQPISVQVITHETRAKYYAQFWDDSYQVAADESLIELPRATQINLFAHELSHSFDPDLIQNSVIYEKNRYIVGPERDLSQYFKDYTMIAHEHSIYEYSAITTPLEFYGFTQNQMIEGVPDFFATLVTAEYITEQPKNQRSLLAIEGMMDLIVDGCKSETYQVSNRQYPSIQSRIEKIYFTNSQIAEWVSQPHSKP